MAYCGREATPGTFLALVAVFLLSLVCISVPITSGVYFVQVQSSSRPVDYVLIGLWGWCFKNTDQSLRCSDITAGFNFDRERMLDEAKNPEDDKPLPTSKSVTGYLALSHIPAAIMAGLIMMIGIFGHCRSNRNGGCLRVGWRAGIAASALALFALVFDMIQHMTAVGKINGQFPRFNAKLANAFYMSVAGVMFIILASFAFTVGQRINQRLRDAKERIKHNKEMSGAAHNERTQREDRMNRMRRKSVPQYAEFEEEVVVQDGDVPPSKSELSSGRKPGPGSYPLVPLQNRQQPYPSDTQGYQQHQQHYQYQHNQQQRQHNQQYQPHYQHQQYPHQQQPPYSSHYQQPPPPSQSPPHSHTPPYPPQPYAHPPPPSIPQHQQSYPPPSSYPSTSSSRPYPPYNPVQTPSAAARTPSPAARTASPMARTPSPYVPPSASTSPIPFPGQHMHATTSPPYSNHGSPPHSNATSPPFSGTTSPTSPQSSHSQSPSQQPATITGTMTGNPYPFPSQTVPPPGHRQGGSPGRLSPPDHDYGDAHSRGRTTDW